MSRLWRNTLSLWCGLLWASPVPMTQSVNPDGRLYRVTPKGELNLRASGFLNPTGVAFRDNRLLVSDINGDFPVSLRELPDGFIVAEE